MKKVIIFLSIIVVLFGGLIFLSFYQKQEALKNNPYDKTDLHSATIDQLKDPNYRNVILPKELDQVLAEGGTQTVYFFSPLCSYCKQTTPIVVPMTKDLGIDLKLYNVLEYEEAWDEFNIEGTPTIIHFKDGKEVGRIYGFQEEEVFKKWFEDTVVQK